MSLEIIVALTIMATPGSSCAAIDNGTNEMVWGGPTTPLTTTTYTDYGSNLTPVLMPEAMYPDDVNAILSLVHAEELLLDGPPSHKVPLVCFKDVNGVPHEVGGNGLDHDHA